MTADTDVRPDPLRTGAAMPESVGRYKLVRLLGAGAFGRVFLALDPRLGRDVAIKVPASAHLTEQFLARFRREGLAAALVRHDNVCRVLDADETADGRPYFVFEYVNGPNLEKHVAALTRLRPREAARILAAVARGVEAAHAAGVIHRDLKPANVLMDVARGYAPVVTDFGVARLVNWDPQTRDGQTIGSPAYMSPEQWFGELDKLGPWSDVYSLGVILFELVVGDVPYKSAAETVLPGPPRRASAVRAEVPAALCAIACRAMQRVPADRYQTAAALAAALDEWLAGPPPAPPAAETQDWPAMPSDEKSGRSTDADPGFRKTDPADPVRRGWLRAILAGGAVGLAAAAAGILLYESKTPRPAPPADTAPR